MIDARTIPAGTVIAPDIAVIGGGPAGISLALALADSRLNVVLLESGGLHFDPTIQKMYRGAQEGVSYVALDGGRLRYLGGSTNHWGGWCRPLDSIDFEARDWFAHSGWPFTLSEIQPYFARAQALCEAGPWLYDNADDAASDQGRPLPLGPGGVYTSWFQFSKTRDDVLPPISAPAMSRICAAPRMWFPMCMPMSPGWRWRPTPAASTIWTRAP